MDKKAFTLAEVLITLGIIGVVAALTIPALIQSYKKQVATVRLKQFYSTMEQAIKLSEIDNGPVESWGKTKIADFYETYIKPYLRATNKDFIENSDNAYFNILKLYLPNGSRITISFGGCIDFGFDINGEKSPNSPGKDMFYFLICQADAIDKWGFSDSQSLKPYADRSKITDDGSISRKKLLEECKSNAVKCSALLMYDNFEFKDDYPYKL